MPKKKIKALVLFSGGLDSILAVKLLQKQNIDVTAISFYSPFFNSEQAKKSSEQINIKLIMKDFSKQILELAKNSPHGYGKNMNPCIDCHATMLKEAKKIMKKQKYDFIATGEVLNERPMSQSLNSLQLVEKLSGLKGFLLRPLSAKRLPKTIMEEKRIVNRDKLEAIEGRSRKRQLQLAKKYKIKKYPAPAGGCLLTDANLSIKLKELLDLVPDADLNDVELLKYGRHFWDNTNKIVIGRDEDDNKNILTLAKDDDIILKLKDFPGPDALIRFWEEDGLIKDIVKKASILVKKYSVKAKNRKNVIIIYRKKSDQQWQQTII